MIKLFDIFSRKKEAGYTMLHYMYAGNVGAWANSQGPKAYLGWVYACVNKISDSVSNMNLTLQHKTKNGWETVENHEMLDLLHSVNTHQTFKDLIFETVAWRKLSGEAFWHLVPNLAGTKPVEIEVLDPTNVQVMPDPQLGVAGYKYTGANGKVYDLKLGEVIHFKTFNPWDRLRGMSVIKAAATPIDTDKAAGEYNRKFFANNAVPDGLLSTEQHLSAEQLVEIREQWNNQHMGPDNAHKTGIVHSGLKYQNMAVNQKEMDFLESRKANRDEILAMFGVPIAVLGTTEGLPRANIEGSEYVFAKYTVDPEDKAIVNRLNEFLLAVFKLDQREWRLVYEDVIPENVDIRLRDEDQGIRNGVYTINELRSKRGLKKIIGGDVPYINYTLMPLGEIVNDNTDGNDGSSGAKSVDKTLVLKRIGLFLKNKNSTIDYKEVNKRVDKRKKYMKAETKKRKGEYKDLLASLKALVVNNLSTTKMVKDFSTLKKEDSSSLIVAALNNIDGDWSYSLEETTKDTLEKSYLYAGIEELAKIGVDIAFDLKNPRAVEWLKNHALEDATSIKGTMRDKVAQIITDAVDEGLGLGEVVNNLSGFFDDEMDYRAERIARTEVAKGYSNGSLEGDRQSGVVKSKRWIIADSGCCDDCQANADQGLIPLEQSFQNGDDVPPAHPNCRCDYNGETEEV